MNLALFDFDGTITASDTWTPFMKMAISRPRLLVGQAVLAPVVLGYRAGIVRAPTGRRLAARVAFAGQRAATIRQRGMHYATDRLPRQVRSQALERLEWHRVQGDRIVVVSAALDVYLLPWCRMHGVEVICTVLEERAGRFTGRCVDGDCSGAEKARRVHARYDLTKYASIYAYGDSIEDREMLECATEKYYRWEPIVSWADVSAWKHPAG